MHCVVPGGDLTTDGHWISCCPGFFLPVRVLAAVFRGKFVAHLRAAYEACQLRFQGALRTCAILRPSRSASIGRWRRRGWSTASRPSADRFRS
ncbi:MAG: transposase [Planctomycetota bacterium]